MGVYVLAAPFAPPVPIQLQYPLQMTWEGPDGSVWDLTDWRAGVTVMQDGITGLHNPSITKFRSESSAVPGYRTRGWRTTGRDVFWPVFIYGDGSEAWRDVYSRFFATIHPERAGVWTVTAGESVRRLRLVGVFDDELRFPIDPFLHGWAQIPVTLEAEQPYWEGTPQQAGPFGVSEPVDFISEDGAPSFYISDASTIVNASISNPGDVDSYLVWTARGPWTALQLGVGSVTATIPFELADGDILRIDTDPRNVAATLNGTDVTPQLGLVEFGPVPPGEDVSLTIDATGAGTVSAALIPLHFRAM